MRKLAGLLMALTLALGAARAGAQSCTSTPADQTAVTNTMKAFYKAASAHDAATLHRIVAPDAVFFDGGQEYTGIDELADALKVLEDQGARFVWSVTKEHVTVRCNDAWIRYVNDGSIQMPGSASPTPTQWLESAVLERQGGAWKIVFFHSTRVPAKPAA